MLVSIDLIVPIHKSGDTCLPDNYRGISLLCSFSKNFAIGRRRLELWCESEDGCIVKEPCITGKTKFL